ncbi:MAG: transglycosylase domain-containing protein, partial [Bacteroidota bacterium]
MRLNYKNILQKIKSLPQDWPAHQAWAKAKAIHLWENRPPWQQVFRLSMFVGLGLISLFLLLFLSVYLGAFGKLPTKADLREIRTANASEIYAADGVLLGKYYAQNRTNATLDEIPYFLINALVATEDARFYRHKGIDSRALLRVALRTVLMGDLDSGGGSTISQQLIKNIYSRQRHGMFTIPVNKLREMILATRIEKVYSKAEIMELYLNTVPFGERDVYGVKVASKRFFNQTMDELKMQEAAVLVGMLKGNTLYNPISNPERSKERRNTVLGRMVKYNFLTQEVCDSLSLLPLETSYVKEGRNQGLATYFRAHIQTEIETVLEKIRKPDGSAYNLETDGLKIYTSIDASLQQYAEEAMYEIMPQNQANFQKDWKGKETWLKSRTLDYAIKNSARYKRLKNTGLSEEDIMLDFEKPIPMDLFTWDTTRVQEWSPLDSIKHYLSLLHTGMIAIEPQTGAIKAWIGGINHGYFQYDHVKAKRQVGSTFKPIVYASALEDAQYPCDFFENKRETYPEYEDWSPRNSDGKYGGYYSMPGALSKSVNTVSVQLILDTGIDPVRTLA